MEDADAEGLYALPLEEFTAARNQLAAARRKAGDRPAGEAIRALPKPSRTAWALNQVARRQPDIVERVLDAGRALRAAHARALEGDAGDLRTATRTEQEAVRAAVEAARRVLAEGGGPPSAAQLDRLRDTVQAAAVSTDAGEHFRAGRLVADLHPSGFVLDDWMGSEVTPAPAGGSSQKRQAEAAQGQSAARQDSAAQEQKAARAEARRRALRAEAEEATAVAERLGSEAAKLERRATVARREAADAVRVAEELQQRAVDARQRADEALEAAATARRAAEGAAERADG